MKRSSPKQNSQQAGQALLLVMIISTFIMGIWAVSFRITRDAIDTEAFHNDRRFYENRIVQAASHAGNLLEQDQPGTSRYRFVYAGRDSRGAFRTLVEIRRQGGGRFEIRAQAVEDTVGRGLPENPTSF